MNLAACCGSGKKFESVRIFRLKRHFPISIEDQKLIYLLRSCNQTSEISQIHGFMVKNGLDLVPFSLSKLLVYSTLDMDNAVSIFNHIRNPNLFMFNTMMRGYSISEDPRQAFFLLNSLRGQGILPDQFSFISALKSCARELAFEMGQCIHGVIVRSGYELYINLRNSLLQLYSSCGRINSAHQLFYEFPQERDLVSWNTLMGGYLHLSQPTLVMELFRQMRRSGFNISPIAVLNGFSTSGDLRDLHGGKSLYGLCIKIGYCGDQNVMTAAISMFAKIGLMDFGRQVFDEATQKDLILWNCVIDGYAKNGLLDQSLALLHEMKLEGVKPNSSTLAGLLSVCAASGSLAVGQCIKGFVEEEQLELDVILGTSLINMYSKCGLLEEAIDIFDRMKNKDVKSWTAMIDGFGLHGQARRAIGLFCKMEEEVIKPNEVTFLAILNACSHGGLVTEGKNFFERMVQAYGFSPKIEHYGCMIDLLGRAGLLEEAYKLIKNLPIERDATAWRALLAACRVHGNADLGELVRRTLVELNDKHPSDSILMSSTYAVAGRFEDISRMRESMDDKMVIKKVAGCSSIEMDSH